MHNRLEPKKNKFLYDYFLFYLDIDEIDEISEKFSFISRNKFNLYNFRDKDHIQLPRENPDKTKNIKQHIHNYLKQNGVDTTDIRIMLLTNLCTMGYQFNPVSFYYCFDKGGKAICCVPEIGNTFLEMKPYFLAADRLQQDSFKARVKKMFYVSPFIAADTEFDFDLQIPNEKLNIRIDDYNGENRFFISTLTGNKVKLSDGRLLWYGIRFPFVTLKVISLIHWQAMKLWLKKVPYFKKSENKELQENVMRPYKD